MPSYQEQQKKLFNRIEASWKKGQASSTFVKQVQDYSHDTRLGLTGVTCIPKNIGADIENKVIRKLRSADPNQYYYGAPSLHLTIQNIRTSNDPPLFSSEDIIKVKEVFAEIIPKHHAITFMIRGIFELPTSIALRCYSDKSLTKLVKELMAGLETRHVPDNKRYGSLDVFFGNITICRYTSKPNSAFFEELSALKNIALGSFAAKKVLLITTNPVCSPETLIVHAEHELK